MPSWPSPSGSAHGLKVWNHRCLIGHSGNDTPLFSYKWNKTKVSHLLVMSIQSIHYWSSIKHTDYSSPVLRECHHQANMAARCPDVENNPGSNQVNIRYTQLISTIAIDKLRCWIPSVLLTLWIQLRPGLRDCAWKVTNGHSRKLTKLSMTIFSKFWSRDRYPICIHGSRSHCFTCIAEQVSSEVVDMFLGAGGTWPVISRTQA